MPAKAKKVNVRNLLAFLGGITEAHAALAARGVDVKRQAVAKWQERNSIPGGHMVAVIALGKKKDPKFDLETFQK